MGIDILGIDILAPTHPPILYRNPPFLKQVYK